MSAKSKAGKRKTVAPKRPKLKLPPNKPVKSRKSSAKKAPRIIPAKSALLATIPNVTRLQFTANSQAILLARKNKKTLTLWDLATATETPPLKALPTFTSIALSTDSRLIAMGTSTGILAVKSTQTGKVLWKTKATGDAVGEIGFTLDGSLMVAGGPGWLRIHSTQTGELNTGFDPVPGAACPHLAFSPDGLFLAHSEIHSNSVLVWHLPTRQVASFIRLPTPHGAIRRLAFGPTVRQLYIAQQHQISGWNAENGIAFIEFPVQDAESLAVIEQGNVLAVTRAGMKPALDIWSAATGRLRRSIPLPPLALGPLSASSDGQLLALCTGGDCWLWRAEKLAAL